MNKLHAEYEYQSLLRAIADTADELVDECDIFNEQKASISRYNSFFKEIYPFFINYSKELSFFYDLDQVIKIADNGDDAASCFLLIKNISRAIDYTETFPFVQPFADMSSEDLMQKVKEFVAYTPSIQDPDDKEKYISFLSEFFKLNIKLAEVKIRNEQEYLSDLIFDSSISQRIVENLFPKNHKNITAKQDDINIVLYDCFSKWLDNYRSVQVPKTKSRELSANLKKSGLTSQPKFLPVQSVNKCQELRK